MDYTSRPTDIETVRLDECEGTLRRDVPADLLLPNGAWVLLRRYISKAESKAFGRELREIDGRYTYPEGQRNASEEHIAERELLVNKRIFARIVEWRERDTRGAPLALSLDALDELPITHYDALLNLANELERPAGDEDAFRLAQERRGREARRNGHEPGADSLLVDAVLVAGDGA